MREIKFRGKRLDNGEWVYGYPCYIDNEPIIITGYVKQVDGSLFHCNTFYFVILETIGQYTGQKDINGREIYEGDIVTNGVSVGVVIWHDVRAMFIIDCSQCDIAPMDDWCELKRIGNIYENPELLKENG